MKEYNEFQVFMTAVGRMNIVMEVTNLSVPHYSMFVEHPR